MPEHIDHPRRRFFSTAALTVAAAQFGLIGPADAQSKAKAASLPAIKPGTNTSFASLKQIDAGVLNVGYAEAGPADGPRSFSCTAGPTTFTAMSMSPRCWRRRATG